MVLIDSKTTSKNWTRAILNAILTNKMQRFIVEAAAASFKKF